MFGKIDALLNEKLSSVEWGEYKLEDLFESSNGNVDIQKENINGKGDYVITSGFSNNGILGKTDIIAKVFDRNTLTVDMFGYAFYRNFKYKLVTHARVFSLKPLFKMTENQGLFFASSLNFMRTKFGYNNMCSWEKIKKLNIKLPIKNEKVDFDFMESFISELEEERISELEAYLQVTGLDNYELTEEEQKAIDEYEDLEFDKFDITNIFNIKNTKNILSRDIKENSGNIPYLCASSENNSVSSYINYRKELQDEGNCIFIGGKTFVVSYQEKDFYSNDSHNLALYLKDYKRDKYTQLFLATCVEKSLSYKYSWGNSVSGAKIKKDLIALPVKNKKINYTDMSLLISAIHKLVIKDVVLYKNKKIELTKKIIDKN